MTILYVDISLKGHRTNYLKALSKNNNSIALLPELSDEIECKQIIMTSGYDKKRNFLNYSKWIKEIQKVVVEEQVELVHILCGDALYRFLGLKLSKINVPIVVTYHHMQFNFVRNISLRSIFKKTIGIVHTKHLEEQLNKIGIYNVNQIEYPVFGEENTIMQQEAKRIIGLELDVPCLVTLGGTQHYKGIDILLKALKEVRAPFNLYITGVIRDVSNESIDALISTFSDRVVKNMHRLSEDEYRNAIAAADVVVLPYRKEFDGASGPMIEAVWNRKYIVGAAHGSMGRIINENELGKTFCTENIKDLSHVLEDVLKNDRKWSLKAELFRNNITVEKFLERNHKVYIEALKNEY